MASFAETGHWVGFVGKDVGGGCLQLLVAKPGVPLRDKPYLEGRRFFCDSGHSLRPKSLTLGSCA